MDHRQNDGAGLSGATMRARPRLYVGSTLEAQLADAEAREARALRRKRNRLTPVERNRLDLLERGRR